MYAAGGVAAALFARERTGAAQVVDVSLLGRGRLGHRPAHCGVDVVRHRRNAPRRSLHARTTRSATPIGPRTIASSRSSCWNPTGSGDRWSSWSAVRNWPVIPASADADARESPTAPSASPNWTQSSRSPHRPGMAGAAEQAAGSMGGCAVSARKLPSDPQVTRMATSRRWISATMAPSRSPCRRCNSTVSDQARARRRSWAPTPTRCCSTLVTTGTSWCR